MDSHDSHPEGRGTHGVGEHSDPTLFWEEKYGGQERVWSGRPNATLVDAVSALTPGRAVDLGCGEGGDVVWLAQRGWSAQGIDISPTAVARARQAADDLGLTEQSASFAALDLSRWRPDGRYDLVCASFLQSPVELARDEVLRRALAALNPGGRLAIVSHAAPPPWSAGHHDHRFATPAEEIEALRLDPAEFRVLQAEVRTRPATGPDGQEAMLDDVLVVIERIGSHAES
jgi:SAM-dependent methyltransferase